MESYDYQYLHNQNLYLIEKTKIPSKTRKIKLRFSSKVSIFLFSRRRISKISGSSLSKRLTILFFIESCTIDLPYGLYAAYYSSIFY